MSEYGRQIHSKTSRRTKIETKEKNATCGKKPSIFLQHNSKLIIIIKLLKIIVIIIMIIKIKINDINIIKIV